MIIDFHTHRLRESDAIIEVVSLHGDQADRPIRHFTRGYHPWWTNTLLTDDQLTILSSAFLADPLCLAIGECGLDKLQGVDLDLQEAIFVQQIQLANILDAPIIVHCVRSFDRILKLKKQYGKTPWVIHGFVRNKILANQALDAGLYLSIAPHDKVSIPFHETLISVPLDKIFLETDSDDTFDITARYRIFAGLRSITMSTLEDQLFQNFKTFFASKWQHHNG
jgi:TatD DNase family protein